MADEWWDINLTIQCSQADAERIFDAMENVICPQHDADGQCFHDFVASIGPSALEDE